MKARTVLIVALAIIVLSASGFFLLRYNQERADEAALDEQLRLAKAEGIPTTWPDYAAGIKVPDPDENAGPLYTRLPTITLSALTRISDTTARLVTDPTPANRAYAAKLLDDNTVSLAILDTGSKRPHCWFDIGWSKGLAFNNYATSVQKASRLINLRAAQAASKGDNAAALRDIEELTVIARQVGEEGDPMAAIAAHFAQDSLIRLATDLAFRYHNTDAYLRELSKLIDDWPAVDIRRTQRDGLLTLFDMVRLSTSQEGRRQLGMDRPAPMESINPWLVSRTRARAKIVRAERQIWQSLNLPYRQRKPVLEHEITVIERALAAYPSGLMAYLSLVQPTPSYWMADLRSSQELLLYKAVYRALSQKRIPTAIKTNDLLDPFDGTPPSYAYDGKRITITIGDPEFGGSTRTLKIPREPAPMNPRKP